MTINEINNAPNYAGIYCFRNTVNGKCYIGQAIKLKQRLRDHWNNWKSDRYAHLHIYKAFRKYGIENFELTILQTFSDALNYKTKINLDILEKKYIEQYDSYNNGYNMTLGGDAGVLGFKMTDEQKEKIRQHSLKQAEENRAKLAEDPNNWIKCKNIETKEEFVFKTRREASESLMIKEYIIQKCLLKTSHIGNKVWQFCYYNEEFEKIPDYNSYEFDEWYKGQFKALSNKEEICDYIRNNPTCSYAEVKQIFELSRKTFYNYRNELGIKFDQRIDTKVTKDEFNAYQEHHTKEECMFHFDISERLYYKYLKKYQQ